jgi:hypothetical protein
MKRRKFGLLAGASAAAAKLGSTPALAQAAADPTLLTTTLTPYGAERAGNADGSIPAWTGGITTPPAGWQEGQSMPDIFADEQPTLTIDASNMAQYADKLSEGVMAMMTKYGYSIKVYPTHRTAGAPQSVYDNIAQNISRAHLIDPANPQNGFTGGFGGIPFPIPDVSNPLTAGAQIINNHNLRWQGYGFQNREYGYAVNNGGRNLTLLTEVNYDFPYYYRKDIPTILQREFVPISGPANVNGEVIVVWYYTDETPQQSWELLQGQGRVRKAPEIAFDTPSSFADGIANYDEYLGFNGQTIKYDWKYIGKKEMYIPYNNNGMFLLPPEQVIKEHFFDPAVVRWELHRVWVVDATLHPGERNVLAHRRFYMDEDTWMIAYSDAWDANGNLYKVNITFPNLRPDLPGVVFGTSQIANLQTGDFATPSGVWDEKARPSFKFLPGFPDSTFDPTNMAAAAQY